MPHTHSPRLALLASSAILALLAACSRPVDTPELPRTGAGQAESGRAGPAAGDAGVTAAAKAALMAAPDLSALRIDVDTKGGVVTLKGDVKSLTEKSKAEQVVASVSGVQSVVNDLRVTG